jgi:hypothetical protein
VAEFTRFLPADNSRQGVRLHSGTIRDGYPAFKDALYRYRVEATKRSYGGAVLGDQLAPLRAGTADAVGHVGVAPTGVDRLSSDGYRC